ncbi:MAG: CoA transferase, partial [Pseudomonadota bacterium]
MSVAAFTDAITEALSAPMVLPSGDIEILEAGATLPSVFPVSDLVEATVAAATRELLGLTRRPGHLAQLDRTLANAWFGMTLQGKGWSPPSPFDAVSGDYQTKDGWIRLHTIAPHHRAAALSVLDTSPDRDAVANAVATWSAQDLEAAVVAAGGASAELRTLADWDDHPQGQAVDGEPLIAFDMIGTTDRQAWPKDGGPPLKGLKVLDLTSVLAGPVSTRFLAAFGANVLRIDPPEWTEPGIIPEVSVGKRCAGLDLRAEYDREIFERLLRQADVLVHGYRPGALDGLGFGAEARAAIAPHLIDVALCAYGWTG